MMTIGLGTASVSPRPLADAFRIAAELGYDGVEVMVTAEGASQHAASLRALSRRFGMPVLSIHAPVLVMTTHVFGFSPLGKLRRSVELADAVGASTVVVHPPFRWQRRSARQFVDAVHRLGGIGPTIAVENMFPVAVGTVGVEAYAPSWNPGELDLPALTLDFSHASLAGVSALDLAAQWGPRLRHVHLCDGSELGPNRRLVDEHLPPGAGAQPVAETLRALAARGFSGHVIAEVGTHDCRTERARRDRLADTLAFARRHSAPHHSTPVPARSAAVS